MDIQDLTVEVRDANLERVGQILATDLVNTEFVLRFNNVGSWRVEIPTDHPLADAISTPGSGIIVTGPQGVLLSGPMTSVTIDQTDDDPRGTMTVEGTDDSVILGQRLAYPTPDTADVTNQFNAYDKRTGLASTVMLEYVDANLGSLAPIERAIPALTLAPDPLAGSTTFGSARFDIMGELLTSLATVDGLGFDILQQGPNLEFRVFEPEDKSAFVRMDVANDTLASTRFSFSAPGSTVAIVGGAGSETDRIFTQVTTSESTTAQNTWARRIETFIDENNTSDTDELNQAGLERLADDGKTQVSLEVVPSSDLTMTYGFDWNLGDVVSVVVDDDQLTATVTSVAIKIQENGVYVGATVGKPEGVDYESRLNRRQATTSQRVNALERKESPLGSSVPTGPAGGDLTGIYPNPTLVNVGTVGQYVRVTTDAKGRVISGWNYRRFFLTKNGTLSVANATNVDVSGWTTVDNIGGFSVSGGVITVTNSGIYNITVAVSFEANNAGARAVGLAFSSGRTARVTNPANTANVQVSTVIVSLNAIPLVAGETITIQARQTSGGAINIVANPDTYVAIQSA